MSRSQEQLRRDALAIWQAGVEAVRGDTLVQSHIHVVRNRLLVAEREFELDTVGRIAVVGAGKAGAGMAAGLEEALGQAIMSDKQLTGWINVPADCVCPLNRIHLHAARPPGVNQPTQEGVTGTKHILELVSSLMPDDLCICLISGGGSALLPAPAGDITLSDKQAVTSHLSDAGANIGELNIVRKQLSAVKGGGLARACRAQNLISLIISDVLGDPLEVIASGPTAPDTSTPQAALDILDRFHSRQAGISPTVFQHLRNKAGTADENQRESGNKHLTETPCEVENVVLGNNAVAVDAAGVAAEQLGYCHAMMAARQLEGQAEDVGRHLAETALHMCSEIGPDCLITGGEPVVTLVDTTQRGLGGRNQQLVLAALDHLGRQDPSAEIPEYFNQMALLSGGTDGEDGPTDAAGAFFDGHLLRESRRRGFDPRDFLMRNDAYHFFAPLGGLIRSGPTHTNVCDLRVVVVNRSDA